MKRIAALTAALLATAPALAVEQPYLGVSYVQATFEPEDFGEDFTFGGAQLRGGSMLTEHWGVEAHAIGGTIDDTHAGVNLDLKNAYGVYGVGRLGMGKGGVYAYVGYATTAISQKGVLGRSTDREDGMSYGVGIDFPVFWGLNLEADYKILLDKEEYTLNALTVGLRHYFD